MARPAPGDLSGAVADLGVFVPLVAALVVVNGLHPGPALVAAGLLGIAAGRSLGVPFPVQPLKALSAVAIAGQLDPAVIHAAGLQVGAMLLLLGSTGLAERVARAFTRPVIRALQLGVGVLLVRSAVGLALDPPAVFAGTPEPAWTLALAVAVAAAVGVAARRRWHAAGALILLGGVAVGLAGAPLPTGALAVELPSLVVPDPGVFATAFTLLVVPQLPLTFGNAVVGVSDLARETFGPAAARVTPGRVCRSAGLGNVVAALVGGVPMCHGSSGLSAHVRLGARTPAMNLYLGVPLVVLGLAFADQVLVVFGLLPVWALAGFLAAAGTAHAALVRDLRGRRLAVALLAGGLGIATGNLAVTTAVALAGEHLPAGARRLRAARSTA